MFIRNWHRMDSAPQLLQAHAEPTLNRSIARQTLHHGPRKISVKQRATGHRPRGLRSCNRSVVAPRGRFRRYAMPHPRLLIVSLSTVLLSACVVAPYPRHVVYAEPVGYDSVVVEVAPPPPYVEVIPVMPYAGAFWVGGYWGWNAGRHQWVPGRWDRARPGYNWRPHAWVQQGGRWHMHAGGWARF